MRKQFFVCKITKTLQVIKRNYLWSWQYLDVEQTKPYLSKILEFEKFWNQKKIIV